MLWSQYYKFETATGKFEERDHGNSVKSTKPRRGKEFNYDGDGSNAVKSRCFSFLFLFLVLLLLCQFDNVEPLHLLKIAQSWLCWSRSHVRERFGLCSSMFQRYSIIIHTFDCHCLWPTFPWLQFSPSLKPSCNGNILSINTLFWPLIKHLKAFTMFSL